METIRLFHKEKRMYVDVYHFFDNKTVLIFDPHQAAMAKGNGWSIVNMKRLIPEEYVTDEMFMSKSKRNKIKNRLTLTKAIWTCTDGTSFNNCDEAIEHESKILQSEQNE